MASRMAKSTVSVDSMFRFTSLKLWIARRTYCGQGTIAGMVQMDPTHRNGLIKLAGRMKVIAI